MNWDAIAVTGRELEAQREKEEQQERLRCVTCPDCAAKLKLKGPGEIPEGTELVFVEHAT